MITGLQRAVYGRLADRYEQFRLRATRAPIDTITTIDTIATIAAKKLKDPGRDHSASITRHGDSRIFTNMFDYVFFQRWLIFIPIHLFSDWL
jgi:hypothetical protein